MLNQFLRVGVQNGSKKIVTFPDKDPIENMEIKTTIWPEMEIL